MKKRVSFLVAIAACLIFAFAALSACGGESDSPKGTISSTKLDISVRESATLTVTIFDTTTEIVWGVEDSSVAEITTKGFTATVTGVSEGSTVVTVKNKATGEIIVSCDVNVTAPAIYINLPNGLVLRNKGSVATVRAYTRGELEGEVTWEISDTDYATVEYQGLIARVTAVKKGTAEDGGDCVLTVRCGDLSASIPVYIGML